MKKVIHQREKDAMSEMKTDSQTAAGITEVKTVQNWMDGITCMRDRTRRFSFGTTFDRGRRACSGGIG